MSITRREFLVVVALVPALAESRSPQSPGGWEGASSAPGARVVPAGPGAAAAATAAVSPIVSFHLDQPYFDLTGLQKPYVPPVGMRSGASLAALSQEEVLSRFYGFI
jgi:hypothetical protein